MKTAELWAEDQHELDSVNHSELLTIIRAIQADALRWAASTLRETSLSRREIEDKADALSAPTPQYADVCGCEYCRHMGAQPMGKAPPRTSNADADADEAQKHQFGSADCACEYCRNIRKKEDAK